MTPDPSPTLRPGLPVRWHLAGLAIGAVLPSVVFAVFLVGWVLQEQQAMHDRRLLQRARALSGEVDREIGATLRTLQALAESEHLDEGGDLGRFQGRAVRFLSSRPSWRAVLLTSPDGAPLLAVPSPLGPLQGEVDDPAGRAAVVASGQPEVSDLVRSAQGEWTYLLSVPVVRDGRVRFVLSVSLSPKDVREVISVGLSDEEWTRTVVDSGGRVVARTRDGEHFVGAISPKEFLERLRDLRDDATYDATSLEGAATYVALHRSRLSGWVMCVAVPQGAMVRPVRTTGFVLLAMGLSSIGLGAGGAFLLGRRLSRAIGSARLSADALAHGGAPSAEPTGVAEVTALQEALVRSAGLLRARAEERDQHLARAVRSRSEAEAARAEAEAANRVKDEFLAMLGHELRNPLAPMTTALELLRSKGQANLREHAVIERQVRHLTRLVDDLLDIARITRGALALERRALRVDEVVARGVEMAAPLLEERQHALAVEVTPPELAVHGDPDRLAQVVANLLTNAARYTPPRGHIRVSAARAGDEVELSVTDDGRGIAPELLPRIFDMFVQGPRGADRQEGGLGLGLTIVKSLVAAHDGRIEARSGGVGEGSTFVVRLPVPRGTGPTPDSTDRPRRAGPAARVLVVDDNLDAAELLGELLEEEGHTVGLAHDGATALEVAARLRPDLAILDIGLPSMDGHTLGIELRRRFPDLGLIALTGYGQAQDRDRSAAAGFDRHLVKPPDVAALLEAIAALVAARAARRDQSMARPSA